MDQGLDRVLIAMAALFLVMALLIKCAIVGPQKQFARVALILLAVGSVIVRIAAGAMDFSLAFLGAVLMIAGLAVAFIMEVVGLHWSIDKYLANRRRDRR